jgi:hypothetical protein
VNEEFRFMLQKRIQLSFSSPIDNLFARSIHEYHDYRIPSTKHQTPIVKP